MISRTVIALGVLVPLLVITLGAEPLTSIPNPRVSAGTWATDMPGALRAETIAQLNSTIGEFERTTGGEMAVVVIGSLDGLPIEETAVKLFELWGIGNKSKDNGLLFLWSTGDRRVRVEVGYGLEGVLPDGKTGAILDAYPASTPSSNSPDLNFASGDDGAIPVTRNGSAASRSARSAAIARSRRPRR